VITLADLSLVFAPLNSHLPPARIVCWQLPVPRLAHFAMPLVKVLSYTGAKAISESALLLLKDYLAFAIQCRPERF
jgi:hypothetical protein